MSSSIWPDYVDAHPEHRDERPRIEGFGDSAAMADALLALVLAGTKRATAALAAAYDRDGDPIPVPGDHWVVTDEAGDERAVLRTREVRVGRLDSVDEQFARDEGEGDLSVDWWLTAHREFFAREVDRCGIATPNGLDALDVVFERFEVVWPVENGWV